jgi:translation initiation factor 3 subunit B
MELASPLDQLVFDAELAEKPHLKPFVQDALAAFKATTAKEGYETPEPVFHVSFASHVMFLGLPSVPLGKAELLTKVLAKLVTKTICPIEPQDIDMPVIGENSNGVAFLRFPTEDMAKAAAKACDNLKLDKAHTIKAFYFDTFEQIVATQDHYTPIKFLPQAELKNWLLDAQGRDQFIIRYGQKTEVMWNDPLGTSPELIYAGPEETLWTEQNVKWTSEGTYLATLHPDGVLLWGGPNFEEFRRFNHKSVTDLSFSPCERFLVTYNAGSVPEVFRIWEVLTGVELRSFFAARESISSFTWSFSGAYLSRRGADMISVFKTEDMSMIEDSEGRKTSLKIQGLSSIKWSPSNNKLAYFFNLGQTSQIHVVQIPNRIPSCSKSTLNAVQCEFYWSPNSELLAGVVAVIGKKSVKNSRIELILAKRDNGPALSIESDQIIQSFAWESESEKFGLIKAPKKDQRKQLEICSVNIKKFEVKTISLLETKCTELQWAPQGEHLVLYNTVRKSSTYQGMIQFYSMTDDTAILIEERSHPNLSEVSWDPSGRYLVSTTVQQSKMVTVGCGYIIWNCQGQQVFTRSEPHFFQFDWRPRPKQILGESTEGQITSQLKQMAIRYEHDDKRIRKEKKDAFLQNRQERYLQFKAATAPLKQRWIESKPIRNELLGFSEEYDQARWRLEMQEVETLKRLKTEVRGRI